MKRAMMLCIVIVLSLYSVAYAGQHDWVGNSNTHTLETYVWDSGQVLAMSVLPDGDTFAYIIDGNNTLIEYLGYRFFHIKADGTIRASYDGTTWDTLY